MLVSNATPKWIRRGCQWFLAYAKYLGGYKFRIHTIHSSYSGYYERPPNYGMSSLRLFVCSGSLTNDPLAMLRCLTPGGANRLVSYSKTAVQPVPTLRSIHGLLTDLVCIILTMSN